MTSTRHALATAAACALALGVAVAPATAQDSDPVDRVNEITATTLDLTGVDDVVATVCSSFFADALRPYC